MADDATEPLSSETARYRPAAGWESVIASVRQGSERAAQELIECLYPKLIRIVRNHRPSSVEEEDIMQDIFLKVFSKIDQFKGTQPFDHWVARIAINTCYDRLRQHKARRVMSFSDFSPEEAEFLQQSLHSESQDSSTTQREGGPALLASLLETLKPHEQMVLRLLDLEEKSVAEVSSILGWGASRVKVTAFRARRKLTATLARLEEENAEKNPTETPLVPLSQSTPSLLTLL